MRKISLRSFSHNVLFITHAVFFSQKTKKMFYPFLASLLIIEHKGTKFLKGIFRFRYRYRLRYR